MKKFEVFIQTNKVGSRCADIVEFEDEEWEDMSESEREETMKEIAFNYLDWGFKEL